MSRGQLVFVTGASGYLGAQVVYHLLEDGYRVRAYILSPSGYIQDTDVNDSTARGAKAEQLKAQYGDKIEVVTITDVAKDQFPEALAGVDALVHVASPLPGRAPPEIMFQSAVEGTLNIVRQAETAGIRNIVVTSSVVTVNNPQDKFTDPNIWNPVTKESALASGSPGAIYGASKKYAELALWEWASAHPHVEITTIHPPFIYGPFAPGFTLAEPNFNALSTNLVIYNLLFPDGVFALHSRYIDVRDAAKAHVRALEAPPTARVGRKRIFFMSRTGFNIPYVLQLIAEKRPALKDRLTRTPVPTYYMGTPDFTFDRVEEVLGIKESDLIPLEQTVLETVDQLIELEDEWKASGYTINKVPSF
ncbi:NAD(P)-binding protein [Fistulina hepatica ATCC 64428]|uniref:NAD(P)-binding protein n=1 Tax=Fistulina hepatica ATCC 64428 TaxID=1128425 RepID=A0A0D7ANV2_9AGAR|nr:NAD(P)-binding protein [Fistulina hepatica ATCC 64428]